MVIYIDILLCLNMIITYFMLLAVCAAVRRRPRFLRLLAASVVGALSSLSVLMPPMPFILGLLYKAATGALIVLIAFSWHTAAYFFKRLGLFLCAAFVICGILAAAAGIFSSFNAVVFNMSIYLDISPLLLIAATSIGYLLIRVISRLFARTVPDTRIYRIELVYRGASVVCDALADTGNNLIDLYSGAPVIIIDNSLARRLVGLTVTANGEYAPGFRLIPYSVIGGGGLLPVFTPDDIILFGKSGARHIKASVAVCSGSVHNQYRAIIPTQIIHTED